MKKIMVIFGGTAPERDVSVITGVFAANALDKTRYEAVPVFIRSEREWFAGGALFDLSFYKNFDEKKAEHVCLLPGDHTLYRVNKGKLKPLCAVAAAINCTHGAGGEDGTLSGLLSLSGIPVVGGDTLSSSVAMDKVTTKLFLKGLKLPALPAFLWRGDYEEAEAFGYPVIVKPARLGSSIGISRAENRESLFRAVSLAEKYDDKILIERALDGFHEVNCACYRAGETTVVSECEMPVTPHALLTFADKYTDGAERLFPAPIDPALAEKIREMTKTLYESLEFTGIVRVDYLVKGKRVWVNEINAIPGSLAYYLFTDTVSGFTKILTALVEEAREAYNRRANLLKKFPSKILELNGAKGGKRLK